MGTENRKIQSFTDLVAWKEAHQLALAIYKLTSDFPGEERYGLTSQIRRAAASVASNIAEGFSRSTGRDRAQFYTIAVGSLTEVQSQLLLAKDLKFFKVGDFDKLAAQTVRTHKLLSGLVKSAQDRRSQ